MDKPVIYLKILEEDKSRLKALAKGQEMTLTGYVRMVLKDHLKRKEEGE